MSYSPPNSGCRTPSPGGGEFGASRLRITGPGKHDGLDFTTPIGTPLYNKTPMTVQKVSNKINDASGKYMILRDSYGSDYVYAHLDKIPPGVKQGQSLPPGTLFGYTGNSGLKPAGSGPGRVGYAPHLHFEAWPNGWKNGKASNPENTNPNTGAPYWANTTYNLDQAGNPVNDLRYGCAGKNPNAKPNTPPPPTRAPTPPRPIPDERVGNNRPDQQAPVSVPRAPAGILINPRHKIHDGG
jgi:hypothetical protein